MREPAATDAPRRLVYAEKGWKSGLAGLLLTAFGVLCFWLAMQRPGEENGWVPWVVGAMFSAVGLFTLFGRAKTVFDGRSRTWSESWGFLFVEFRKRGWFDDLTEIVIEESYVDGFSRYYVWVKGKRSLRLLPEITATEDEANRVVADLAAVLHLPVKVQRDSP